ncbi:HAD family hydrolase [Gemelliphila palaticanis]|uniref:HAD family phosphatase n=1 Tax=Gemelliphila palaticanis TaxID=81950 RepID=A0ABX2SYT7_9BACL|nr:HAD family phosphatase [Gemella palaticanis]MBF0715581.1 HAD family phosphatase [Gemella palaticanis]NYS47511.1 HAD family phosphatase [Gemella palaticanis]
MIKAVLFDMDGLMFDTESLSTKGFIESAKKQGYDMTVAETHLVLGFKREDIFDFYEEYFKNKKLNVDGRKLVADQYDYLEHVLLTTGPDKMPYLVELLDYLKNNKYKIAVASSSDIFHIKNNLEKNNLLNYIDTIASGEEVSNGKPAPDIFLLAASRLDVTPDECLVLEDSIFGMEAAHRAGMKSIMIPDSVQPDEKTKKTATAVLKNLGDVITFLKENN